jgi:hypothetical protein
LRNGFLAFDGLKSFEIEVALALEGLYGEGVFGHGIVAAPFVNKPFNRNIVFNLVLLYLVEVSEVGFNEGHVFPDDFGVEVIL